MLNFIFNRPEEPSHNRASSVARAPSRTFGLSLDTPDYFSNRYTVMNPGSIVNPHLEYNAQRIQKMSSDQRGKLNSEWTKKSNPNLIEENKVINLKPNENEQYRTLYHDNYQRELKKNNTRFRLTKGEFSNFIESQRKNEALGPLQGPERNLERARETRKSILQQSQSSLEKLRSNPSTLSVYRTSTLWREKQNIRKSRDQLQSSFRGEIQSRRYSKSPQFLLPKVIKVQKGRRTTEKTFNNFNTIDLSRLAGYNI